MESTFSGNGAKRRSLGTELNLRKDWETRARDVFILRAIHEATRMLRDHLDEGEAAVRASTEKEKKERLASARSPSERSWWAGKILQQKPPDTDEDVERLRKVCLHAAKQTFLSPRVYGMVSILDEDDLWLMENTGSAERPWKIDHFVRAETGWTLDWRRVASEGLFTSPPSNHADAEEDDEEVFLRAAPYLRRVSLLVHREWFSVMPPDRFVELYDELLGVSAWPRV